MYGRSRTKWHPIAEFLLFFVFSTGLAWVCIGTVRQGSFMWGSRFGGAREKVTSEAPLFWLVVAWTAVCAVIGFVHAARILIRYLRQQT